jgi:hypothetical protein
MWVQIGLVAGRVLLRLLIRLAPLLAVGGVALFRKYRWPLYYRLQALKPTRVNFSAVPAMVLGSAGGLILLAVALYFLVTHLSPHA